MGAQVILRMASYAPDYCYTDIGQVFSMAM